jgi:hypothetical protein
LSLRRNTLRDLNLGLKMEQMNNVEFTRLKFSKLRLAVKSPPVRTCQ